MRHLNIVVFSLTLTLLSVQSLAEEEREIKLQSFEPNTIGINYTRDEAFIDVLLSQMYPMFHSGIYSEDNSHGLYFAVSVRFGFYWGTRDSSPVIGKRFNPEMFYRFWLGKQDHYIDATFGHESNGQSINSEQAYLQAQQDLDEPEHAIDYISRGYDYVGTRYFYEHKNAFNINFDVSHMVNLRYFLEDGPLQGEIEQYYPFEDQHNQLEIRQVNGIFYQARLSSFASETFRDLKININYITGYKNPFKYNTVELELTKGIFDDIPITLFFRTGYNSDLAHFYVQDNSYGIKLELKTFLDEI
ncbi:hypothetical protein [Thalassotalea agarivorans]|uniref:Uncharacterized protein n=1 Tax=Thalassotalea agarivorans TaxID=349064 RepID=A0A1I0C011_THASX|nr:hypothetical protein [Thalassotalea agarivorans]SET12800.1 hypothetical protein SAMN05660429_01118 [Thalassotalea agarivorans]